MRAQSGSDGEFACLLSHAERKDAMGADSGESESHAPEDDHQDEKEPRLGDGIGQRLSTGPQSVDGLIRIQPVDRSAYRRNHERGISFGSYDDGEK